MELMLERAESLIWGWPLLILILASGAYLTVRLRFLTLRRLPEAMRLLFRRGPAKGGVTPFGAFCTAMSATIGTGNLVGVATALALGGPGALFWMELSAVTGMAVKYAEGLLAIKYRFRDPDGSHRGGPFAYILLGLGSRWKPLAASFALFGALAGLCGAGTFVQIGSFTACLRAWLQSCGVREPELAAFGRSIPILPLGLGLVLAAAAGVLILGGIGRISRASAVLVPLMGGGYLLCCLFILLARLPALPEVLKRVMLGAFRPDAAFGGLLGAVQAGVSRGVFSNEAGLGTAPIAAAAAEGTTPAEQGLISMTASVFDTLVICTLTGLVILLAGTWQGGVTAVMDAFAATLPLPGVLSRGIVALCLGLFSFTTVVSWSYYAVSCLDHLTGSRPAFRKPYLAFYVATAAVAPCFSVRSVWMAANIFNGLMAVPNLIGVLLLTGPVLLDSRDIMVARSRNGRRAHGDPLQRRPGAGLREAGGRGIRRRSGRPAGASASAAGRSRRQSSHGPPARPGRRRADGPGEDGQSGLRSVRADPRRLV